MNTIFRPKIKYLIRKKTFENEKIAKNAQNPISKFFFRERKKSICINKKNNSYGKKSPQSLNYRRVVAVDFFPCFFHILFRDFFELETIPIRDKNRRIRFS